MKKLLILMLLIASLVAPMPIAQAQSHRICLAYDAGGPGDDSFNDAAQAGLKAASTKLKFTLETTVTSGEAKDRKERLTATQSNVSMLGGIRSCFVCRHIGII